MALWRLVRALFGRSHREADVEEGTFEVHFLAKEVAVVAESVPTFKPDTNGVPMLVLASMEVGAAHLRTEVFPGARLISMIVVTPPPVDHSTPAKKDKPLKPLDAGQLLLRSMTNTVPRVHGKVPRKARVLEKENLRDHPSTPRLAHPNVVDLVPSRPLHPVQSKVVKPGASHSPPRQPRPRLTPVNLTHHASVPARIPLADRLRRAAVGCASPPPAVRLPPASLSSTSLASATSSESIAHILGSVLDTFEADLKSPLWFGLSQFGEYGGIGFGEVQQNGDGDEDATQSDDNAFDI
ncbi:hypothetical protein B0H14DRAFT_3141791 [Mycena olivaceomarginata]|nr:hypothetical protein B0H14DRAFT_3141791 [Mycena olivaceomarginata]